MHEERERKRKKKEREREVGRLSVLSRASESKI